MSLTVNTNASSINTQKWLTKSTAGQSTALERLSSGYKINSAKDDAAGIAIALRLNVKGASVSKAIENGNQATSMLETAESGVTEIANILTRLKELATEAASDTVSSSDRVNLNAEATALTDEINKISDNTRYGSTALLDGTATFTFQLGDTNQAYNQISVSIANLDATALGLTGDLTTAANSQTYLTTLDTAVNTLNLQEGTIGAAGNKIGYHVANLESTYENTTASASTIKDADYAAEMADFTKYQVLVQAGVAMLSQANSMPQQVLSLLQG